MHGIFIICYIRDSNLFFLSTDSISFLEHFCFPDTRCTAKNGFHTTSHIKKVNILWTQDWHKLIFMSHWFSVLSEVFNLSDMKNGRKHLPCSVYKNSIKSPYKVITLTFHLLFNFNIKHTLSTQYNRYLYKTWRNQRYS